MAVTETIVPGRKYRIWQDGIWKRLSFWTKASDVECEDGTTVEDKLKDIKSDVDEVDYEQWNAKSDAERQVYGLVKVTNAPEPATTVAECQEQINELTDSLSNLANISPIIDLSMPLLYEGSLIGAVNQEVEHLQDYRCILVIDGWNAGLFLFKESDTGWQGGSCRLGSSCDFHYSVSMAVSGNTITQIASRGNNAGGSTEYNFCTVKKIYGFLKNF